MNSTSTKQNREFLQIVISDDLLQKAIDWISHNLEPEDVFKSIDLMQWAVNNGYQK